MARPSAELRLARLLVIIPWIVDRQGATIAEIAERFSVPEDDVLDDLSLVQCCEIPPYGPDHTLGIVVVDDEVLVEPGAMLSRPLRLGPQEGFGLLTAGRAALAAVGDETGALSKALVKLEAALGDRSSVHIEFERPELLDVVERARDNRSSLDIEYYTAYRDELTTRTIDPYLVANHDGDWFVQAWCHRAGAVRTFRVDRIEAAEPHGSNFDEPTTDPGPPRFGPGDDGEPVTLRLPPTGRWVVETYPTRSVESTSDGGWIVTLEVAGDVFLERLLLRAGPDAQVMSPVSLESVGRDAALRMLSLYEQV
jgi:proteasome accessory factor C